ncbi:MAG: hypothetical protein R3B45_07690 [Bdellovibrionota bacterium]
MKKTVAKFLILLGLLNLSGFIDECFAADSTHSIAALASSGHDHHQDSGSDNDDERDCDTSTGECANHCHFGHCFLSSSNSSVEPIPQPHYLSSTGNEKPKTNVYLRGLFRPPIA